MSNHEMDRIESLLDLASKGQMVEALSVLHQMEAGHKELQAPELEACRQLLTGLEDMHAGQLERAVREALPALAFLEQRYRNRLAVIARNTEVLLKLQDAHPASVGAANPGQDKQPLIEQDAQHDTLTGSLNQAGFITSAGNFFEVGQYLALVMADVDHLKSINDHFGVEAGDKVLQTLTQIFHKSLRDSDLIARVGNDEFQLLINGVETEAAWGTCERLRLAVERYGWGTIAQGLRVTISIGLAVRMHDETLDLLTSKAEEALQHAKAVGHNKVMAEA